MSRAIALLCSLLLSANAFCLAFPEDWRKVGETELKVLWFNVYRAELKTSSGLYHGVSQPLLLQLDYKRNITKNALIEKTRSLIETFATENNTTAWVNELATIWPDIHKGDQLIFWKDSNEHGHFFYNGLWIGAIHERAFSRAFINIWLSPTSEYPKLAKELRGEPQL